MSLYRERDAYLIMQNVGVNEVMISTHDEMKHQIKELLRQYEFATPPEVSYLTASENQIYIVNDHDSGNRYVVRINSGRLAYHNAEQIHSEMMWLDALSRDTDIIVPRVLAAKDGSWVQELSVPGKDKPGYAVAYSFLEGVEPPENELLSGFERLGTISAHMHAHATRWVPPEDFSRPTWTPEAILNNQLAWGDWREGVNIDAEALHLLQRAETVIHRRLEDADVGSGNYGLIHADLRLANLLIHGATTAIIDFDDCGLGWYLFDLAGALSFLEEREDVPDLINSWVRGYRKVAEIPADAEVMIPTLIMLRRIQLIGWLGYQQNHLDFARQIGQIFTTDSCRLAGEFLDRFG
ncbi:MAG: aminoglycoside phosphotransferase [Acidiferrobacteraceae bacterium]|nr:aminoglycoside phosphotransferase [Acidiferrobacteraceae bacterium]